MSTPDPQFAALVADAAAQLSQDMPHLARRIAPATAMVLTGGVMRSPLSPRCWRVTVAGDWHQHEVYDHGALRLCTCQTFADQIEKNAACVHILAALISRRVGQALALARQDDPPSGAP